MANKPKYVVPEHWFNRLVGGAFGLGFVALAVIAAAALYAVNRGQEESGWVSHTFEVRQAIAEADLTVTRLEANRRALLLMDNALASRAFDQAANDSVPAVDRVLRLTRDNPVQQRRSAQIRAFTEHYVADARRSIGLIARGDRAAAVADFRARSPFDLTLRRRAITQDMLTDEERLLQVRLAAREATARLLYVILGVAVVIIALLAAASIVMITRYTRDLTSSRNQLRLLNEDLEGAVRERTVDLQRANDEIQRFAYIVSHDLRSPLVNVMGFTAELENATKTLGDLVDKALETRPDTVDPRAIEAVRTDLPEATGFIRTSTQKMDRLINAILRLSREGRRTITPEKIDLATVTQIVADSLKHRVDEIGAVIHNEIGQLTIINDRLGIEQILSNLVENAVKYLKPGIPGVIHVRAKAEGNRVFIEVIDNGRGIDPRDHDRVFDLFRRSGVQDQPGEGIGLAHVRAMAYRLGGTIGVSSALGKGATFRVNLPLTYAGEANRS